MFQTERVELLAFGVGASDSRDGITDTTAINAMEKILCSASYLWFACVVDTWCTVNQLEVEVGRVYYWAEIKQSPSDSF